MIGIGPAQTRTARRLHLAPATTLALLALAGSLAACSSNSSGSNTPSPTAGRTFDSAGATTAVKQTWTTFFSKNTPIAQKETLLQNGTSTMASAVQAFASNSMVGEVTADVQNVSFPSSVKADVTYSISLSGQVVENAMAGNAVYQDGKWLVADTTLCGLLQLAESQSGSTAAIPGCG
jgi:hypothetical protein